MSVQFAQPESPARTSSRRVPGTVDAIYFVTADADPGMAPRLVEPFAKMGVVPVRIHVSTEDGDGAKLSADLRLANVTHQTAHLIDKALRRIVGVHQVIVATE